MTTEKPNQRDIVRLLESVLDRAESIDRNVDKILDWLSDHLDRDYSWYSNDERTGTENENAFE